MPLLVALSLAGVLVQPSATPSSVATLSGRVVEDGSHAPVPGATVTLVPERRSPPPVSFPTPPLQATTDQDGRYVFEGVAPGVYLVNAHKTGFAARPIERMPPRVQLRAGERSENIDIVLLRGGAIAGRVLDQSGQALADFRVMAMRTAPGGRGPVGGPPVLLPAGSSQTNDIGEFRVFGLPAGEYYLQAAPRPDFPGLGGPAATASSRGRSTTELPTYFPDTTDPAAARPIRVEGAQTTGDIVIHMLVARALHVSGLVVDESGAPVNGAMITLMPDREEGGPIRPTGMLGGPPKSARTDAAGHFAIANVTAGSYVLRATAPIVIASAADGSGAGGGGVSFSTFSGGTIGSGGGGVTTETRGGTTVQFRDDTATRVNVSVADDDVSGLQIVVRRPQP